MSSIIIDYIKEGASFEAPSFYVYGLSFGVCGWFEV